MAKKQATDRLKMGTVDGKILWVVPEDSSVDQHEKLVKVVIGADNRSALERLYEVEALAIQYAENMGIYNTRIRNIRGPYTGSFGNQGFRIPENAKVTVVGEKEELSEKPPFYSIVTLAYG